jgi:hypothetical protein
MSGSGTLSTGKSPACPTALTASNSHWFIINFFIDAGSWPRLKTLWSRRKRSPGSLGSFLFLALALAELMAWLWHFPVVSPSPVYTPATWSCSALF